MIIFVISDAMSLCLWDRPERARVPTFLFSSGVSVACGASWSCAVRCAHFVSAEYHKTAIGPSAQNERTKDKVRLSSRLFSSRVRAHKPYRSHTARTHSTLRVSLTLSALCAALRRARCPDWSKITAYYLLVPSCRDTKPARGRTPLTDHRSLVLRARPPRFSYRARHDLLPALPAASRPPILQPQHVRPDAAVALATAVALTMITVTMSAGDGCWAQPRRFKLQVGGGGASSRAEAPDVK